ncbi:alpha/beta hydrolase fold domain-containing protein [Streptomyces sp. 4N124]|uniref:alpha/beta hydrolase fold domain-containing protein n=1 Tax=Streptomyces sp. 4N124 TaxID=3457420 RepID=UPI003FD0762D
MPLTRSSGCGQRGRADWPCLTVRQSRGRRYQRGTDLAVGAALALARTPFAEGYGLTSQAIEWFIGQYLTHPDQRQDPRFAPVLSPDLATLPPAVLVGACGCCPSRSRPCRTGSGCARHSTAPPTDRLCESDSDRQPRLYSLGCLSTIRA